MGSGVRQAPARGMPPRSWRVRLARIDIRLCIGLSSALDRSRRGESLRPLSGYAVRRCVPRASAARIAAGRNAGWDREVEIPWWRPAGGVTSASGTVINFGWTQPPHREEPFHPGARAAGSATQQGDAAENPGSCHEGLASPTGHPELYQLELLGNTRRAA
jgi:hypothetical protein